MSIALFIVAFIIFAGSVFLFGAAKRGEQQTLGGIVAMIALLVAALGALAKVAGYVLLLAIVPPAFAHDHKHPERNDWLKSLHSKSNTWCCDGNDVTYLDGSDWGAVLIRTPVLTD